jgi:hypothetical protein
MMPDVVVVNSEMPAVVLSHYLSARPIRETVSDMSVSVFSASVDRIVTKIWFALNGET